MLSALQLDLGGNLGREIVMEFSPGRSRRGRQLGRERFRLFTHEMPCRHVHLTQRKVVLRRQGGLLDKLFDGQRTHPGREARL